MRTHIIPAQITTVEDKIAGNLNLTQLILLMTPVIFTAVEFIVLPPKVHISFIKMILALLVACFSCFLAIRIRGKVMLSWMVLLLRYNLRPRFYVLNKNDSFLRDMYLPVFEKRQFRLLRKAKSAARERTVRPAFAFADAIRLQHMLDNPNITFFIKPDKKGVLNVGIEQVK